MMDKPIIIIGIDPKITDTKFAVLSVDQNKNIAVEEVNRIQPPSSFSGRDTTQIHLIATHFFNLIKKYGPRHVCIVEDYSVRNRNTSTTLLAKVIGVLQNIVYEYSISFENVRRSETKLALGLNIRATEVKMYNKIVEVLNSEEYALSGCYAIGAAMHLCDKVVKNWKLTE